MINFVEQIAEDGLLAKRELNTPAVLHLFRYNFIVQKYWKKLVVFIKLVQVFILIDFILGVRVILKDVCGIINAD